MIFSTFGTTFPIRTNEGVLRTGAEDSSDGRAALYPAYLGVVTGPGGLTGVLALVVNAGNTGAAVVINPALSLHRLYWADTSNEAIAPGARVTGALRLVVGGHTGGVLGTGAGQTDGAAGLRDEVTGLVLPAVLVSPTLHTDTGHQGVALQAGAADTFSLVELHQTLRPAATGLCGVEAGVETVLGDASFVEGTVSVGPTLRPVTLAVGVPSVALRTGADRVVGPGGALGLGGAGVVEQAGVNTVLVDTGLATGTLGVLRALRARLD